MDRNRGVQHDANDADHAMKISTKDGTVQLKSGKPSAGDCCCRKCEGPCDNANPCPDGCYCCNGQCKPEPCEPPPVCEGPCVDCWEVLYACRYGECFGQNNPWPDGGSNDPGIAEVKVTVAGQFPSRAEAQEFIDKANLDDFYCAPMVMTGPDLFAQGFTDCKLTSGPTLSMRRCPSIGEAPCPEGCECVDGQCVAPVPCPQIVSYGGSTITFFIGDACSGEEFNNDPEGQAGIAQAWMDAIAEWMNANGYTDATGGATAPTGPTCTACVGPDASCDLWGSVNFGVSACCDGVQEEDFGPEWLDVFGDVFPGQDPPFYWMGFSGAPSIPPCVPNELP